MRALDDEESELEASRAPLLEHLTELRTRLIICVAAVFVAFLVCFWFAQPIYLFLLEPYAAAAALFAAKDTAAHGPLDLVLGLTGVRALPPLEQELSFVFTAPLEFFFTKLKLAGFGAVVVSFPIIAWQLYRFVAPGLYRRERKAFLPFMLAAPVLFLLGSALVYFVMLPFIVWFSLSQQIDSGVINVALLPKVSDYLSLVTTLLLAFGLSFQLPVVVALMGLAGLVSAQTLAQGRRFAIVGVVVLAAVVTPPDPISQLMLAIPLVLLYEASIWCVRLIELRRKRQDLAEAL